MFKHDLIGWPDYLDNVHGCKKVQLAWEGVGNINIGAGSSGGELCHCGGALFLIAKESWWGKCCERRMAQPGARLASEGLCSPEKRMLLENMPSRIFLGKVAVLSPTGH